MRADYNQKSFIFGENNQKRNVMFFSWLWLFGIVSESGSERYRGQEREQRGGHSYKGYHKGWANRTLRPAES